MILANPFALLWELAAIPIVIVYLWRGQPRREVTATGMFWDRVLAQQGARSAWQRCRRPVSLAVQLLVLTLIVVAMAEPLAPKPRRTVLVIDNSSVATADRAESTRLQRAKDAAEKVFAGLRPCDRVAVLSTAGAVGVRCNFTADVTMLRETLGNVPPVAEPSRRDRAVAIARQMLAEEPGGRVVLLPADRPQFAQAAADATLAPRTPWWVYLIGPGMLMLVLEWGLYQRRWIS